MGYIQPLISDFKVRYIRDFPFGSPTSLDTVRDDDIQIAFDESARRINPSFAPDQDSYSSLFLQLAAHYMTMNLRASAQGIAGKFPWLDSGKGAGGVSVSSAIPQRILDSAAFSGLSSTRYGAGYLLSVLPYASGRVATVRGQTKP